MFSVSEMWWFCEREQNIICDLWFSVCVCCVVQGEEEVEDTPTEMLYLGMLPNLSQYVVSGS